MLPEGTFFGGVGNILRVVVVGTLAYVGLVLLLRISGKRTLSKMNAFDFVVTVALGSTLATIVLSKSVALIEGLAAFALLISLQFAVTWSSVRSKRIRSWVKSEPRLLLHKSVFLENAMRDERVTRDEIISSMRQQGHNDPSTVESVVLETDGSMSVTSAAKAEDPD